MSDASADLMRHLIGTVINSLLSADANALRGAEYGMPRPGSGELPQRLPAGELDTRVGTIDVTISTLRSGSYFLEMMFERSK